VNDRLEEVDARVLPTPGIMYANEKHPMIPSNGAWNMKNKILYKGAEVKAWGLVDYSFNRNIPAQEVEKYMHELIRIAKGMGISIGQPTYKRAANQTTDAAQIVTEALTTDPRIELLMVILPGKTPFYAQLKTICDTARGSSDINNPKVREILESRGLSTQCIQAKNVKKCNPMTLAQLCLKINAKMGGINNSIDRTNKLTRPGKAFSEPVIFLGADVTHPGIGDKTRPSIAAVVGSLDSHPIRYAVSVRAQKHRMEVIEDLKNITKELLKQFLHFVRKKPAKIIMFRDGVSEGQFQQVLVHEMTAIQQACTELEPGYQPGITFVIVQKRHHARFKVTNQRDADRSGNCPAGTTIDTGVCHPTEFDYYQYSHAGIQGTSRPTHYHVLWDDNNFNADEMQALSFMLCHLYVRCTRSVSIPAPAYYAHHVAYRARYHLQKEEGSESSQSGSDSEESLTNKMVNLNLRDVVKPHPLMVHRMYFV